MREPHLLAGAVDQHQLPAAELQLQEAEGQLELLRLQQGPEHTGLVHRAAERPGLEPHNPAV